MVAFAPPRARLAARSEGSRSKVWYAFAALGVLLAIYLGLLLFAGGVADSTPVSWLVDVFEAAASGLCIARGLRQGPGRAVAIALGFGSLAWALGDFAITIESLGGASPPVPSVADGCYIWFYPLTYIAVVLFMRGGRQRLTTPSWLDGGVAGLGAATICAEFAFHHLLTTTGSGSLALATNLIYPVGDVLLLALIVGSTAVLTGQRRTPWFLLAAGLAVNVIGDTFNLLGATDPSNPVGHICDAMAWPASLLLLAMSVWLRPRPTNPLLLQRPTGFVLPGLAAIAGLVVLVVGTATQANAVAIGLATATEVLVGIRLAISVLQLRALTQERLRQSITDDLTGLGNRRYLFRILDTFFADDADRQARCLSFVFLDLNRFKEINDTYGHPAGDELLRQLGPRLNSVLRASDALVRLGGDEFAVILIDSDGEAAAAVAQRITACLEEPFDLGVVSARVGASIGIAVAPEDADDSAALMWCADIAMYRAKATGTAYALYESGLDEDGQRWQLVEDLRNAIARDELVLHYQPQLDLHCGEILNVEALLRWPHPRLGMIPPLKLLPIAEEADLMGPLTEWVLAAALRQCAAWRESGRRMAVAVNISPSNLLDPGLTTTVRNLLDCCALPADSLIIEITENSVIDDFERAKQVIDELRQLGVVVSIDDFGAGFTSLAHLSTLAVKELKLDRAFISGLADRAEHDRTLQLVRATIELGHAVGLRVVAEGIEDAATLQLLCELGCDLAQGYFISVPKPADEIAFRAEPPTTRPAIAAATG